MPLSAMMNSNTMRKTPHGLNERKALTKNIMKLSLENLSIILFESRLFRTTIEEPEPG